MTKQSLTHHASRFSIRKYSFGAASVLLATVSLLNAQLVAANTTASTTNPSTAQAGSPVQTSQASQTSTETSTSSTNTNQASQQTTATKTSDAGIISKPQEVITPQTNTSTIQAVAPATTSSSSAISQNQARTVTIPQTAGTSNTTTNTGTARTAVDPSNQTRTASTTTTSAALGDNYPYKIGWQVDPWGMYTRQCTSFVAFRLSTTNGFTLPRAYGNADVWGYRAQREGYRVDMNPAIGSVAWWNSMHVAWVSAINGDMVEIEEYNFNYNESYNKRWIHKNSVSGYIHFKDLTGYSGATTTTPVSTTPTKPASSTTNLAPSGTYTFTAQTAIKAEAKIASPTLANYQAGQSVNYDRVLEADGYQWISYLSFAGNRRYIPIKKLTTTATTTTTPTPKPAPTSPSTPALPSSGTYTFKNRLAIRNQASLSASILAYYNVGQSVNYDRIVQAEGKQWLSYLSYSGARRYIALP
ncbi:YSIRK-type signal peptide-containing protein [Streptococcus suis]|nr:YSIRK-type signal peptide-containing protein [Streptococcus suis]